MQILVTKVKVDEKNRLRASIGDNVDDLAKSMKELGQLVPIIVNEYYKLVAGYRRLKAAKQLKWKHIEAKQMKNLTKLAEFDVELHENWKRKNFTETELGDALLRRKEIFDVQHPELTAEGKHELQSRTSDGKFGTKIVRTDSVPTDGKKISGVKPHQSFTKSTAEILGVSESTVKAKLQVAKAIKDKIVPADVAKDFEEGKTKFSKVLEIVREKGRKSKVKDKSTAEVREEQKKLGLESAKKAMEELDDIVEAVNGVRKEEKLEPVKLCIDCKKSLPVGCPSCEHKYILCDRDWSEHELDEEGCEKYE
jgi:hypothetical protein